MINQSLTAAVERLNILLDQALWWHEPHIRLLHRAADTFGIVSIVLLVLNKRLHILRCDDPYAVSNGFKLSLPIKSPDARFNTDGARR